ncbi:MAG TPA: alkaline phosphatase family protein [Kofleriaceae bacterium]|nr:alkaline phosphatase family protein [Kofleriaceae bacterium]
MRRRDALKTLGAMAGAAGAARLLPGCDDGDGGIPPDGPVVYPAGIHNIVYVMMENRSYDHQLGARALQGLPGDGLMAGMSNPDTAGTEIPIFEAGLTDRDLCVPDPPHSWPRSHEQFANGTNRGFVVAHQGAHRNTSLIDPMQYLVRAHAPVLWKLADEYTTCDRWFCSVMGPTWPNRMFWHAGTSLGTSTNEVPVESFDATIFHRLNAKGVDWKYYYSDLPFVALLGLTAEGHIGSLEDFLNDARAGTLRPFTYVEPSFGFNDDHPPHHPMAAQQFVAMVYTALATSPQWANTLLVITYDEHGGFFDHVPPPTVADDRAADGFDQLGFRVPAYVVGPYVKAGFVSSVQRDHTSALRHLIDHFALDPINTRTSAATGLSDAIDEERLTAETPRDPVEIPAVEVDESELDPACRNAAERRDLDLYAYADAHPELFARWDRRAKIRDDAYLIGDFLEQHNAGRIIRGR